MVQALTLTEIMANPDGNENADEFIELFNESSVNESLLHWLISDGVDTDTVVALDQGLVVEPGQYVLILDPDYLDDSSTAYDGLVPEDALIVTISSSTFGSRGLSNSEVETVSLLRPGGAVASARAYTVPAQPGYSDEKILPEAGDSLTNWSTSRTRHGTPGGRNSVTPPDANLAVAQLWTLPPVPRVGDSLDVNIMIRNTGRQPRSDSLFLFRQHDAAPADPAVLVWSSRLPEIAAGDSLRLTTACLLESTIQLLRAQLGGADEDSTDDVRQIVVGAGGTPGQIVINEIMFNPEPSRCEWVELANAGPFSWNLAGWRFGDGTGIADSSRTCLLPGVVLAPESYVVLAGDSEIFFERIPSEVPLVVWGNDPISLNNTGDSLALFDPAGQLVERVDYRPSWSDGTQGVSLERISCTAPGNDRLNWAASLDSVGATPGRANSRSLDPAADSEALLTLDPNPFTPNGDGHHDLLRIAYRLEHADSRLDLKIFDTRGREVRRLANSEPAGFTGERLWDGTDDSGRELPTGMYVIYLEALGRAGTRIQSAKRVVALARTT